MTDPTTPAAKSGAYSVDAWIIAGALARGLEFVRKNFGDRAADAVHANIASQLEEAAAGFAWRDAMAKGSLETVAPTPPKFCDHDVDIIENGAGNPIGLVCTNCNTSWSVKPSGCREPQ